MIETAKLQMAKKLLKLGGFIKGVKVKISSYYHGFDKQAILKAIIIDRIKHPINPLLELDEKHKILRKRVEYFQEP